MANPVGFTFNLHPVIKHKNENGHYIKHRLSNPEKTPLTLIEVQSGNYLGEDDIVRFDDIYGRSS